MADPETVKKRPRPLVRIVLLLMAHRVIVSFLCCIAGLIALLILPVFAKNTYISENALMPGSASPMLSSQDVSGANRFIKDLKSLTLEGDTAGIELPRMIANHIANLGAEASVFSFHPQPSKFHPLHFFSSPGHDMIRENVSCLKPAISTVGIIRAPRGDGKEAIIVVTPYNALKPTSDEALSLSVAYSVFSLLSQVTWLAKDIIWLAADSRYGEYESVATWLREYYAPTFDRSRQSHSNFCPASNNLHELKVNPTVGREPHEGFRRAGTMAAALVIKVAGQSQDFVDTVSIYAEASNGQMPNLDLINIANYLAVHRQGLNVKVGKLRSFLDSNCLKMVGEVINFVGKMARSLNPDWAFGMPVGEYVEGAATLTSSLYAQALGIPTGPHGAFRDYQIDAITLTFSPKASVYNFKRSEFLLQSGRLIEGIIRSVNNLLEKFHQSFFLYLLTGPSKFVSVGVYMIAFALLIAPLPVVAASLYSDAIKLDGNSDITKSSSNSNSNSSFELIINHSSWRWLSAAKTVFIVHTWAIIVALQPYFVCQIPNKTPTTSILSWILLSIFSLHILHKALGSPFSQFHESHSHKNEWAVLKSMTIAAAFTGLSLMSVVNFATAEIGALLLVPLSLMAQPLKLDVQLRSAKSFTQIVCNLVLGLITFPPFAYFVLRGLLEGFSGINIGDFWIWVESLWLWDSATYLYLMLVHLPCWLSCIYILLHPC